MDLLTLRYFVQICRQKSIAKVAEQFFVSRQALSKSMIKLEEELNTQLLLRGRSGVELTEEGRCLFRSGEQILEQWNATLVDLETIKRSHAETIQVGFGQMSYTLWGANVIGRFLEANPNIDVNIHIMLPNQLVAGLADGTLDLAITSSGNAPQFSRTLLKRRPLYVLLCSDDPLAANQSLQAADMVGRTIYFLPGYQESADSMARFLQGEGVEFHSEFVPDPNIICLMQTVRENRGLYFTSGIFQSVTGPLVDLTLVPFARQDSPRFPSRDIYAVHLKSKPASPAIKRYVKFLQETAEDPSPPEKDTYKA